MRNGMPVNKNKFAELSIYLGNKMDELSRKIASTIGHPLNPASSQQCQRLIYNELKLHKKLGRIKSKGGAKKSTAVDILSRMDHPVVNMILEWRGYQKMKTSYADVIPVLAEKDGRVRTTLRITRTATGRLSSSNPNLMAQPVRTEEGRMIRDGYEAPEGFTLISMDYSQVEMRVAAYDSGDKVMKGIFEAGEDIHAKTASKMFGIPEANLDSMKHRYPAKRVGFGILNLITAKGLHRELMVGGADQWSVADCEDMIESWFDIYRGIALYMKRNGEYAKRYGYVRDMWGRIRYIPGIRARNKWAVLEAERQAGNAPIQMGAQGVIKEAMGRVVPIYKEMTESGMIIKPLIQIHDDIVWEVKKDILDLIIPVIKETMEGALPPNVKMPLEVDVKEGRKWGSMKKLNVYH